MNRAFDYLALSEIYRLPPKGGHVLWLHRVCQRLSGVRLLAGRSDELPASVHVDGIDIRAVPLPRWSMLRPESVPLYANLFWQGLRHLRGRRPRAILSARILPEGLVASALGHVGGVPTVVFAHGEEILVYGTDFAPPDRRKWTAACKRRFLWQAYRSADLIVANSHFTANLLRGGGIRSDKVAIVHPGTDPERFRPAAKDRNLVERLGLHGKKVILTVGTVKERKGQDTVVQALPAVAAKVPEAVYVVGGSGSYRTTVAEMAEKYGVASRVRWLGAVPDTMLPRLYNLADVFIMPNRTLPHSGDVEGFGIVFLEASACEVPVIGGRSGGVPDAVVDKETGLLVDGDSPEAVAEALVRVLTDTGLARRLGRTGRRRVCRELTWDHSAARIRGLIANLAAPRPRR